MNHQHSHPVSKSSRKTGIARTSDARMALNHHTRNFFFQTYAEDDEHEATQQRERTARTLGAYGRIQTPALRDKRLLEAVYEQVALQDHLETKDLHLDVNDGVVVIKGKVSDHAMKVEIAKVVQQCAAVKTIINRIAAPCSQMPGE